MHPGKWEEIVFYDHPSGYNRILMAMTWKAEHPPSGGPLTIRRPAESFDSAPPPQACDVKTTKVTFVKFYAAFASSSCLASARCPGHGLRSRRSRRRSHTASTSTARRSTTPTSGSRKRRTRKRSNTSRPRTPTGRPHQASQAVRGQALQGDALAHQANRSRSARPRQRLLVLQPDRRRQAVPDLLPEEGQPGRRGGSAARCQPAGRRAEVHDGRFRPASATTASSTPSRPTPPASANTTCRSKT